MRLQYDLNGVWERNGRNPLVGAFLLVLTAGTGYLLAQSLLLDYRQGGAFPRWGVPNMDSGVMMGDPAAPIIADFYAFGARDFDVKAALAGLVKAANELATSRRFNRRELRDDAKALLKAFDSGSFQVGDVSMLDSDFNQFKKSIR